MQVAGHTFIDFSELESIRDQAALYQQDAVADLSRYQPTQSLVRS